MATSCRRLEDRVALVLGGGSDGPAGVGEELPIGNGRAIAIRLAEEGARVVVADRDRASADATVRACPLGSASAIELDLADPASCADVSDAVLTEHGVIDIVVANAAVSGHDGLRTQEIGEWDETMAVNATGHWLVAQRVLPSMLERGRGCFVFVGSTASLRSSGRSLSYESSKAAQLAVMRHIAVRYGRSGVRSNAVVLGVIDSPMVRREFSAEPMAALARDLVCPMRRQGTPEEAAAAAAFLASDDASYVNGHSLVVDGGVMAAWPPPPMISLEDT